MNCIKGIVIGLVLFAMAGYSIAEEVVLANGEWEPYLSEKNLKHYGVASHIVTEAFKLVGVTVKYKWYGDAWKRAYVDAKKARVHGSLIWSKKPARQKEMYFSEPVISGTKDVFWHLKSKKFDWNTLEDLKGLKIGATLGYTYGVEVDTADKNKTLNIERVSDEKKNFSKLLKGRIDVFMAGYKIGSELLKNHFTPEEQALITYHPKPFRVSTYHLILVKKKDGNKELMKKFDEGLKQLKDSGRYDQYIKDSEAGLYKK